MVWYAMVWYVCMQVGRYVCMFVCVYVFVYVYTHVQLQLYNYICVLWCVCVNHLNRCKTSTLTDGLAFPDQALCHYNEPVLNILPGVYPISFSIAGGVTVDFLVTPTKLWKSTGWKFGRKILYLQCRSWAHSSRSWGTRHTVFSVVVSLHCQVTTKPLPEDFLLIRLSQSVSTDDSF